MTELERHCAAVRRLRSVQRRDVRWSERMIRHLLAIERLTGRWESY